MAKKIWKKFLLICHGNFYYIDMANLIIMPCQFLFNLLFSVRFLLFLPWQILPFSHGKVTYIATVIFSFCIHVNIIASGNFFHAKLTFMGRCQFTLISLHFLLYIWSMDFFCLLFHHSWNHGKLLLNMAISPETIYGTLFVCVLHFFATT